MSYQFPKTILQLFLVQRFKIVFVSLTILTYSLLVFLVPKTLKFNNLQQFSKVIIQKHSFYKNFFC